MQFLGQHLLAIDSAGGCALPFSLLVGAASSWHVLVALLLGSSDL